MASAKMKNGQNPARRALPDACLLRINLYKLYPEERSESWWCFSAKVAIEGSSQIKRRKQRHGKVTPKYNQQGALEGSFLKRHQPDPSRCGKRGQAR